MISNELNRGATPTVVHPNLSLKLKNKVSDFVMAKYRA